MADAVVVDHVTKEFTLRDATTLKQRFVARREGRQANEAFKAIDDVSFNVEIGAATALMGLNGSGKSTMLKLISGVLRPDSGKVLTRGSIAGLIELSAGFQKQLTGRQNIYLNAALNGMDEREINSKFDEIVDFAGIDKFLDTPLRFYSSGMKARLGFSVAVAGEPDIFIMDEVLAVGDPPFKRKCMRKIDEVRESGCTVLFVSHNIAQVQRICREAVVLEQGVMKFHGPVDDAVKHLGYDQVEDDEFGIDGDFGDI